MTDLEKLIKESTKIVLAMEEVSSEIPKIKELLSECRKLKADFSQTAQKKEKEVQKRYEAQIKRLDAASDQLDRSLGQCEEVCQSFGQIEELVQTFRDYGKKLSELEQRMDTMAQCQAVNFRKDTLLELISANGYRLPLIVVHEKWYDYRFQILRVSDGKAVGDLWRGNGEIERNVRYSLDAGGYRVAIPDSEAAKAGFTFNWGEGEELPFD